jgi:hypothetical protein
MKIHELKIEPQHMAKKTLGIKPYEIRKNDRDFKTGDLLLLREWCDNSYTGIEILQTVDDVFADDTDLQPEYVVLYGRCFNKNLRKEYKI